VRFFFAIIAIVTLVSVFSSFGAAIVEWMLCRCRREGVRGGDEVVSGQNKFVLG